MLIRLWQRAECCGAKTDFRVALRRMGVERPTENVWCETGNGPLILKLRVRGSIAGRTVRKRLPRIRALFEEFRLCSGRQSKFQARVREQRVGGPVIGDGRVIEVNPLGASVEFDWYRQFLLRRERELNKETCSTAVH